MLQRLGSSPTVQPVPSIAVPSHGAREQSGGAGCQAECVGQGQAGLSGLAGEVRDCERERRGLFHHNHGSQQQQRAPGDFPGELCPPSAASAPAPHPDVTLKMLRSRGTAPGVLSCTASPSCMHLHSPQERKPARLSPPLLSGCRSTIPSRGCPGELPVPVPRALLRAGPSPGRYSSVWGRRGFPSATPEPTLLRLTLLNLFPALLGGGGGESPSGRMDSGL